MKKLLYILLFLPLSGAAQTITVQYEKRLRPGEHSELLPPTLILQLNNMVFDYTYRFSRNKSEYQYVGQRTLQQHIPPVNSNHEVDVNTYKDFIANLLYRNSSRDPQVVSQEFFQDRTWEIQPDSVRNLHGYTCRKATSTDAQGRPVGAWYALELAIPDGPGAFFGLRGLILQLECVDYTVRAMQVVIDPETKTEIDMPLSKNYLSGEEFDKRKRQK